MQHYILCSAAYLCLTKQSGPSLHNLWHHRNILIILLELLNPSQSFQFRRVFSMTTWMVRNMVYLHLLCSLQGGIRTISFVPTFSINTDLDRACLTQFGPAITMFVFYVHFPSITPGSTTWFLKSGVLTEESRSNWLNPDRLSLQKLPGQSCPKCTFWCLLLCW